MSATSADQSLWTLLKGRCFYLFLSLMTLLLLAATQIGAAGVDILPDKPLVYLELTLFSVFYLYAIVRVPCTSWAARRSHSTRPSARSAST